MKSKDIIKKAMSYRIGKTFFAHEMNALQEWIKIRYNKTYNVATLDRKFRELREKGEIITKPFKNGKENGYSIIEVR